MTIARGLIDHIDLSLPHLPSSLEGMKIVHVSDLHIRRRRPLHRRIVAGLRLEQVDLAVLTGDYIDRSGHEQVGLAVMTEVCQSIRSHLGVFGVFGNHDTAEMRDLFTALPVHWLSDTCHRPDGLPLEILGFGAGVTQRPDAVATLEDLAACGGEARRTESGDADQVVRILLSHYPTYLPTAADIGVDLMFSGHTHGGQCRLPGVKPFYNSTDLPAGLTSGILRHRQTVCVVSRGLGESILPMRAFCPPHIPVYTLRRGPMPGQLTDHMENTQPW